MAQKMTPVYGEIVTDVLLGRSMGGRPGLLVVPSVAIDSARVTIAPDPGLGFWAWRTRWTKDIGAFQILEDAAIQVNHLSTASPNQVLVGRWKWVEGPIGVDGHPTGEQTTAMQAVYECVAVPSGDLADTVIETSIDQPDANGRYGVVIGRIHWDGANWGFSYAPSTNMDLAYLNTRPREKFQVRGQSFEMHGTLPNRTLSAVGGFNIGDIFYWPAGTEELTALRDCVVAVHGTFSAFGTDNSAPGGGSLYIIQTVFQNGANRGHGRGEGTANGTPATSFAGGVNSVVNLHAGDVLRLVTECAPVAWQPYFTDITWSVLVLN